MLLHFLDAGKFQSLQDFEADFSDLSHGDQVQPALLLLQFRTSSTCIVWACLALCPRPGVLLRAERAMQSPAKHMFMVLLDTPNC